MMNINLLSTLRDVLGTVSTTAKAANRAVTIVDKNLQLAENWTDHQINEQSLLNAKRLADIENKVDAKYKQEAQQWFVEDKA